MGGGVSLLFYLMSGSGLGFRPTACGAFPLSSLKRNSITFFLVYRSLMVLIIAIIININMIDIVTVNVGITGIIIMKTCLFLLLLFSLMLLMMCFFLVALK